MAPRILDTIARRFDAARNLVDLERYATHVEGIARRVDSIYNAWTGLGGPADKGRGGQVDFTDPLLSVEELRWLTRKNQYAKRYVNIFPDYGLRGGWRVADESDDQDPTAEFDKALRVRQRTMSSAIGARKFGGCPVAVVTNNERVDQPFGRGDDEILNLIPLDPEEATPVEWYSDIRDPEFRDVALWSVSPRVGSMSTSQNDWRVQGGHWHSSRIIYIPGVELSAYERLSNSVWYGYDDSVLQSAWNAIRMRTSDDQALSALMQHLSVSVMKIEGLASLNLTDQQASLDVRARSIARDMSLNQPVLMGDGESIETMAANTTGVEHLAANSRLTLASAAGVPLTKFFGDSPNGFSTDDASGQDMLGQAVEAYQEAKVADPWLVPLYEMAAQLGQITLQGDWSIEWPPLDVPTAKEQAETRKLHAEADAIRITSGVLDPIHVASSRFGGPEYGEEIEPIPPEDLAQMEIDAEAAALLVEPLMESAGVEGEEGEEEDEDEPIPAAAE